MLLVDHDADTPARRAIDWRARSVRRGVAIVDLYPYDGAMLLERVRGFHFIPSADPVTTQRLLLCGTPNADA